MSLKGNKGNAVCDDAIIILITNNCAWRDGQMDCLWKCDNMDISYEKVIHTHAQTPVYLSNLRANRG